MTPKQTEALEALRASPTRRAVLHVKVGGALVAAGHATKLDTTGHGALTGEYELI